MRIFLGYGYHDRDRWIEDLVAPIIEAFGAEVVDGKEIYGQDLSEGVRMKIRSCDGLIAFLTRRDPTKDNRWTTHRWVTDELACAITSKIHVLEVLETEIDDQRGMAGDRQYIPYDENGRERCLVELVKAIGAWCRSTTVRLKLLPEDVVREIRPVLNDPRVKCSYRFLEGSRPSDTFDVRMLPVTGGLVIDVNDVPIGQPLIQVEVTAPGKSWTSDFQPVGLSSVHLQGG